MHLAFTTIKFGPFKSEYHKGAVDTGFREALDCFLCAELLPQVEEPFESTAGTLRATFDDQKYCGPNSAVRDLYTLEFEFYRLLGADTIKCDLAFNYAKRSFSPRYPEKQLYLWTVARKDAQLRRRSAIQVVCDRILAREVRRAACPQCGAELRVTDLPSLFDVSCPARCFKYNFHRDPRTGEFQHGHFFRSLNKVTDKGGAAQ